MKRLLAILLLAVMCLGLLTACAREENDKGPIIRMYITGYPRSLDPAAVQPSAEVTKLRDIYGRLRKHDRAAEILDFEEGDDLIERPLDKQLKLRMLIRCADGPQRGLPRAYGVAAVVGEFP